jgi:O-antigen/teichoic acid export membrane protein
MIGIFIGVSISGALFPALSQLGKAKEVENSRRLVRPAIGLLTLMMVLLAMLLSTLSSWLLGYVYGDDYTQGASWLILFALVAPFMAINSVAGAVIGAWGWQGRWAKTLWYLLPIVAVMYVLMSTEFGVWGVALVGVGYQLTMTMITWRWMSKEGIVDSRWLMSLLGLTGALALLFVCVPEHLYWLSLPLAIIGIFALSICKASWIKMAFRVVR